MNMQINVNIWDDFCDDGYVKEGETQETYAYVESNLKDNDCQNVLNLLKLTIQQLPQLNNSMEMEVVFFDSSIIYPNLVGTEHERHLYKRWQLQIKNLSHSALDNIIHNLKSKKLNYNNMDIIVYSES